ncbi:MAG: metal-dependent hydrolase, partial [Alphaproteobacteria bacterium]
MADFATHLGWGAVGAGLAATATYAADIVPAAEIITLTTAGVVGSVLPDIDLEKAIPSRMLFTGLGLLLAFITLFNFRASYSIAELWLIWLGVYLSMRFGAFHIFHRTAKHRGIFHSLIAGVFFMIFTAVVLSHGLHREPVVAWMAGLFVLLGYLIHLVLDEIYSVDFAGAHLKRSFGSALKLFDYKALGVSAAML